MTKIQNPIIGRAKGSAGNMTFSKNFDKNVMRSKPMEVSNPRTTAQVTQRDFFGEVQAITQTVSEEQLRSLFGQKPKGMSRRNALSKQIAAAYSQEGNLKSVDFSKLQAIGNGAKVNTPIVAIQNGVVVDEILLTPEMYGLNSTTTANVIFVVFDQTNKRIVLVNTNTSVVDLTSTDMIDVTAIGDFDGFVYPTCEEKGNNSYQRGFGSFIIKTRAEKGGRQSIPFPSNINVDIDTNENPNVLTLNFRQEPLDSFSPGRIYQNNGESENVLASEWTHEDNHQYSTECLSDVNFEDDTYIEVMNGNQLVTTIEVILIEV